MLIVPIIDLNNCLCIFLRSSKQSKNEGELKKIYTAEELKIDVKKARLMSRAELMEYEDKLPRFPLVAGGFWILMKMMKIT